MFECRAQPIRFEIPDAHLAVRRTSDDRVCAGRAVDDTTDNVDKSNGFYALAVRVAAQGRDDLALAQADDADAAFCAADDGNGRSGVYGERGDAAQVEPGVGSCQLEKWGRRARVPVDEGVVGACGYDAFA